MRALRLTCVFVALLSLVPELAEAQSTNKFGVILQNATMSYQAPGHPEIVNANLGWVRLHAFWRSIELTNGGCSKPSPTPAECNWSNLDQNVDAAYQRGQQIYIGIGFWAPDWANNSVGCDIHTSCAAKRPTNTAWYPAFVKALVKRYKTRVRYYAIWNEPDLNTSWSGTNAQFVNEILVPGAEAVKEAAALAPAVDVKVIGGEVADSHTVLDNMLFGATCGKLDIVAVHLFRYDVTQNTNHLLNDYLPVINNRCGNTKPVWVTAFGFPIGKITPPAGTTVLDHQANLLRNQFISLNGISRVGRIIFYNMVDTSAVDQKTGLLTTAYARKPSFFAIQGYLAPPQTVWVEDSLPAGAIQGGDMEGWSWTNTNPAPLSGNALHHQSNTIAGMHQHFFYGATQTLTVNTGDVLTAFVYLDPANPPTEVMLQWNDGTWEHRAYWGADQLTAWGTNGTASRRRIGDLPEVGKWVRLEVPANLVGLENRTLNGMAFTLYGGRAVWDRAGKRTVSPAP